MYVELNVNPANRHTNDCVVRTIALVSGKSWDEAYVGLTSKAFVLKDMPDTNRSWGEYLVDNGYTRHSLPDTCPVCYSVAQFAADHRSGDYVVACDGHVVAVKDGNYYDTWDSGELPALYYWDKET